LHDQVVGLQGIVYVMYRGLHDFAGSVSTEHGIGLEKKAWLGIGRGEAEIARMRALKRTLDPQGMPNPGSLFDTARRDEPVQLERLAAD
jgi:FAD linked oxidases, C-terminal domain